MPSGTPRTLLLVALLAQACPPAEQPVAPPPALPTAPAPISDAGTAPAPVVQAPLDAGSSIEDAAPAPRSGRPTEQQLLDVGARRPAVVFPPPAWGKLPLTVMLHGMCAIPEWECPVFRAGAAHSSWLLCPPGPAACNGGGAMWSGLPTRLAEAIDTATSTLSSQQPEVDVTRKVLIGYSLGATAALGIITARPGEWLALMLVNASLEPSPAVIQKSGVRRVALVAGEHDGSRGTLRGAAAQLSSAGIRARFFELAATGHYFDATSEQRMAEPVTWLLEGI